MYREIILNCALKVNQNVWVLDHVSCCCSGLNVTTGRSITSLEYSAAKLYNYLIVLLAKVRNPLSIVSSLSLTVRFGSQKVSQRCHKLGGDPNCRIIGSQSCTEY